MDQQQLNAIKERVAKVTSGPWEYDNEERGIWNNGGFNYLGTVTLSHIDAEFIAYAREDVPALVVEVERLREALETVQSQIFSIQGVNNIHDSEITSLCVEIRQVLNGE